MKVIGLTIDNENGRPAFATVVLRPSWLARLFGARNVAVELEWCKPGGFWLNPYTRDRLGEMPHSDLIRRALNCQPIAVLPMARAGRKVS